MGYGEESIVTVCRASDVASREDVIGQLGLLDNVMLILTSNWRVPVRIYTRNLNSTYENV